MSYTYPEALSALESIANDYIKLMRPNENARVHLVTDVYAQTASVTWDVYGIRINMPVRPATSVMLQSEFEDWTAYLLHELGHPTHTDKAAWVSAVQAGVSRMVNALEDVRMEQAVIRSGIVPNAKAVLSRLVSRKIAEARVNKWRPNARKEFSWTICVLGRAANGYAIETADVSWIKSQINPNGTVSAVLGWALPELAACQSTMDCVELATRITKALAAPYSGEGEEGEQGEGEGETGTGEAGNGPSAPTTEEGADVSTRTDDSEQGKGEAGEGEGEGEGEAGEGEGEGEAGEAGEGETSDNGEGKGEGGKGGKGHGDGTADSDETPVTDDDQTEHGLAPESDAMPQDQNAQAEKAVLDILRSSTMRDQPRDHNINRKLGANGIRMRDNAATASRQRALLARALRANETDDREGGRKAGRLDRGALTRAVAGSVNVFARREVSEGYDTDVCVLLDASGSMAGYNMISALEMGLIISQAASSVGASCTTEVFNSRGYVRAGSVASKRVPNPADFGGLQNAAEGGTPLSAHMARASLHQAKRAPQKRRVLFVVTDGGCDFGPKTVKRMATYLEQAHGTVMAHVSIGTPLQGSFRAEVCVPHGVPLAEVGLDHFVKVLQAL